MKARKIIIVVPYKARDLEGHALVGYHLKRNFGCDVVFSNGYGLERKMLSIAPDAIVLDHLSWNFKVEQAKLAKRLGMRVIVLPTEGLFQDEEGAVRRAGKLHNASHLPDCYLTWGDYPRRALLGQNLMTEAQVKTVGCARFDFYREPYLSLMKSKRELVNQLGFKNTDAPLILWATNTPYVSRNAGKILDRQTRKARKPVAEVQAHIEDHKIQFQEHSKIVSELAVRNPEYNFVIKVHPAEWINPYLELARDTSNIRIAYDAPIREFLFHADILLQRNCTTATEAWMLGKPVLNLEIGKYRRPVREEYAVCNHRVYNLDEADKALREYLGGMQISESQKAARDKFVSDFCFKIDGKSSERCASEINEVLNLPEVISANLNGIDTLTREAKISIKIAEDRTIADKVKGFIGIDRTKSIRFWNKSRFWRKILHREPAANGGLFQAEPEITPEMVEEVQQRFDSIFESAQTNKAIRFHTGNGQPAKNKTVKSPKLFSNSPLKKGNYSEQKGKIPGHKPNILLLTNSLLIDRMFIYSDLLKILSENYGVKIWATSYTDTDNLGAWKNSVVGTDIIETFPPVDNAPAMQNYLRRLNEFVWDYKYKPPSRMSLHKHREHRRFDITALRSFARFLAKFDVEANLEDRLETFMHSNLRSEEALARLKKLKPSLVVVTGPFQFHQPGIFSAIKKLNIPTLSFIPSWDNVSTKNRMVYKYDGYVVWSEQLKKELHSQYPHTRNSKVYVSGAPQFDTFFQKSFHQTRAEFCLQQGLNPDIPIIVYALGSPNFLNEVPGAIHLAERVKKGELGNVQMVVRAHPMFDNGELHNLFNRFAPAVQVQSSGKEEQKREERSLDKDEITEWVNTFRHADVVVNLSSTVTIDAAIFDRPVVNLDFDPQPGQPDQQLIKDINHLWTHFKPIAESGGVWLVNDFDEMVFAVKEYLKKPELHSEKRRWIAEYVCGYLDGKCGERMSEAILDFVESFVQKPTEK